MTNHEKAAAPVARLVVGLCGTGTCPTVYRTGHDTVLVQGHVVDTHVDGVTLGDGERLVEIPRDLLLEAARLIREEDAGPL